MLRKRNRAVTGKQALMADHSSIPSPTDKYRRPTSPFFNSPRFFTSFSPKGSSETEAMVSPTSILDSKPFSGLGSPFSSGRNTTKPPELSLQNKHPWEKLESRGVGLALVDVLTDESTNQKISKPNSRMILFGSQLKIQIPPIPASAISPSPSPKSPADFGIKTRNSKLGSLSPAIGNVNSAPETLGSPGVFTGCLSASEMELSEDYTCVISRGPNPRTTHIFDNCIVESHCGDADGFSASRNNFYLSDHSSYPSENFLSFCFHCKKKLGQGKDIYMYRGEKAFCSRECRYEEMLFDAGMEKRELDDTFNLDLDSSFVK